MTWIDFRDGTVRFLFGLAKKVLLADHIGHLANEVFGLPAKQLNRTMLIAGNHGDLFQSWYVRVQCAEIDPREHGRYFRYYRFPTSFGPQRYALLFMPGTYGTAGTPLNFQVGYYTAVAGLGLSPNDVVINGSIDVYNQCASGSCVALTNFWRSLSNLNIIAARGHVLTSNILIGGFAAVHKMSIRFHRAT